jgi:hypothetical protein
LYVFLILFLCSSFCSRLILLLVIVGFRTNHLSEVKYNLSKPTINPTKAGYNVCHVLPDTLKRVVSSAE